MFEIFRTIMAHVMRLSKYLWNKKLSQKARKTVAFSAQFTHAPQQTS